MRRFASLLVLTLVSFLFVSPARAQDELVDNPEYLSWNGHEVGSTSKYIQVMQFGQMNMTGSLVNKLVERADDKLIVERTMTMTMGEQAQTMPAQREEIAAKVRADEVYKPKNFSGTMEKLENETVSSNVGELDCIVFKLVTSGAEGAMNGKVYFSEKVPGLLVKLEGEVTAPMAGTIQMFIDKVEKK